MSARKKSAKSTRAKKAKPTSGVLEFATEPPSWKQFENAQRVFLRSFRNTGNVTRAALAAGYDRGQPYEWRKASEAFAQAWDDALKARCDLAEECFGKAATMEWKAAQAFLERFRPSSENAAGRRPQIYKLKPGTTPDRLTKGE